MWSSTTADSQTFGSLTANPGNSTFQNGSSTSGTDGATFGTVTRKVGGTLNFALSNTRGGLNVSNSNDSYGLLGAGITYNGNDWATVSRSCMIGAYTNYVPPRMRSANMI